jgi:hypothetical protein
VVYGDTAVVSVSLSLPNGTFVALPGRLCVSYGHGMRAEEQEHCVHVGPENFHEGLALDVVVPRGAGWQATVAASFESPATGPIRTKVRGRLNRPST